MKTAELLEYVSPGKQWSLVGEPENALQYEESLTWHSKGNPPSWAALKDAEPEAEYKKEYDNVSALRHAAYIAESDPIYFQAQRGGDYTLEDWKAKVSEIDDRYPYPLKPAGVK